MYSTFSKGRPGGWNPIIAGQVPDDGRARSLVGDYNYASMPRVGEFCASNITRMLLGVVIVLVLVAAVGVWLFHSPGYGTRIERPGSTSEPVR